MIERREFIRLLGGAAVWPVVARAQQGEHVRRIGILTSQPFPPFQRFARKLREYIEGQNLRFVLHAASAVQNLDELNAWLLDKCIAYAKVHHHPELTDFYTWNL